MCGAVRGAFTRPGVCAAHPVVVAGSPPRSPHTSGSGCYKRHKTMRSNGGGARLKRARPHTSAAVAAGAAPNRHVKRGGRRNDSDGNLERRGLAGREESPCVQATDKPPPKRNQWLCLSLEHGATKIDSRHDRVRLRPSRCLKCAMQVLAGCWCHRNGHHKDDPKKSASPHAAIVGREAQHVIFELRLASILRRMGAMNKGYD